jgi:NADPH:quinone reductase-like Zn-dependent oxidoreductase
MKALRIHAHGGPEVMRIEEVPVPSPGAGQVLIRVRAASVNPADWKIREAKSAASAGNLPRVLGRDASGEVAAVGAGVTGVKEGDRVAGVADRGGDGTHAEYALLPASAIAARPERVDDAFAAALGVAGMSAYIPLVEDAKLAAGQRVLVQAGAGGVGGIAIQIARHLGAEVSATCSPANADYVRALGAHQVIDYTRQPLEPLAGTFDVVLDTLGGEAHVRSQALLKPGGVMVCLNAAAVPAHAPRADVRIVTSRIVTTRERLEPLFGWAASGAVKSTVTKRFPLAQAAEAYAEVQTGHARGKLVLIP